MINRTVAAFLAASFLGLQCASRPALAENRMGYQLVSAQQAAALPRNGGSLGVDIGRGQQITGGDLTFELLLVTSVRQSSPAAQAGFKAGDQIIAVDGHVFPTVAAFAAFVGSTQPGRQIAVDYMPAGGGPKQAQRVGVTVGDADGRQGVPAPREGRAPTSGGMSTGTKIAIGIGAAALFGCYELGCFSHAKPKPGNARQPPPSGTQQQR